MMNKADYHGHYYARRHRTFESRDCVICGYEMTVPKAIKTILTCSEYCKLLKLKMQKSKGFYTLCRICDKPIWCQPKKKRQYCSHECKDTGTTVYTSERNIKRGTYKRYYGPTWLPQRILARKRDGFCCRMCAISESDYGKELSVHHIKPFVLFQSSEEANQLSNLLSVCEPCHRKIHSGDMHHSKYIS